MKDQLIAEVQQQMLPYLNNEQLRKLRAAMEFCLHGLEVTQTDQQQEQELLLQPHHVVLLLCGKNYMLQHQTVFQ